MAPGLEKLDFKKELKAFYGAPSAAPVVVDVPAMNFLMVDGVGDPNNSRGFEQAIEALYGVSYTLKFAHKKAAQQPVDYAVMPLEGLWWADDMMSFTHGDRSRWKWTLMVMQPEFVTAAEVDAAIADLRKRKQVASLDLLRFERFAEGLCAQITHLGPYDAEAPNIERLHAFIADQHGVLSGKHHEIYLSDMRRTVPANLKTVLRQPFIRRH